MLGRLKMDIQSCIDAYLDMSSSIFRPRRHKLSILRATDLLLVNGRFDADILKTKIKETIARPRDQASETGFITDPEKAMLKEEVEDQCRV